MSDAPDRFADALAVHAAFPHLLQTNTHTTCAEFIQRFCARVNAGSATPEFGLTAKTLPENGFYFPDGRGISHDAVTWKPWGAPQSDRRQIDIINGAGAWSGTGPPRPGSPAWQPIDPNVYRSSNIWLDPRDFPQLASGGPPPLPETKFATHWFPFMRAQDEFAEFQENWDWWMQPEHKPKGFRVFGDVEGQAHTVRHNGVDVDPWLLAGIDWRDTNWPDRLKRMLNRFGEHSIQALFCLHGGRYHFNGWDDMRRYYDQFRTHAEGLFGAIAYVSGMNEPHVNRWDPREVTRTGRYLKSILPAGTLIALGSPYAAHAGPEDISNEGMQASFDELYGDPDHAGASLCDVHVMRVLGRWSDPASYNLFTDLPLVNGEARAPGSFGSVTELELLKSDAYRTKQAGWLWYCPVFGWGVMNGYIPVPPFSGHDFDKRIANAPNADAIVQGWKEVLEGTTPVPQPLPPAPPPPAHVPAHALLMGQALVPGQALRTPSGNFVLQVQGDGNVVLYGLHGPLWATQTAGHELGNLPLQADGNLVLYDKDGTPLWASNTPGHPDAMVQLQDDGNLVIYEHGVPLWASAEQ